MALDQSKMPCPFPSLGALHPWTCPCERLDFGTFLLQLGTLKGYSLGALWGIGWGSVAAASQFLLWPILFSSLPRRHCYEEIMFLSKKLLPCKYPSQGPFPKELDLILKISLNLSQMSDEKQKFLVGPQDNLKDLSGNCFLFHIYNLN